MATTLFYQRVERLCIEQGISVNALAIKLGLSASTATGWREGSVPRIGTLKKIADCFGVTVSYLRGDTHDPQVEMYPAGPDKVREQEERTEAQLQENLRWLVEATKKAPAEAGAGGLSEWERRFLDELRGLPDEGKARLLEQAELLKLKYKGEPNQ